MIRTERMLRAWVLPAVVVRSARRVQRATRIEHASSDDRMQTSDFPNRSIAFDPQKYRLFSTLEQYGEPMHQCHANWLTPRAQDVRK